MNFIFDMLTGVLVAAGALAIGVLIVLGVAYTACGYDKVASHFPRATPIAVRSLWVLVLLVIVYVVGADVRASL